jgi:hypothetical protein
VQAFEPKEKDKVQAKDAKRVPEESKPRTKPTKRLTVLRGVSLVAAAHSQNGLAGKGLARPVPVAPMFVFSIDSK